MDLNKFIKTYWIIFIIIALIILSISIIYSVKTNLETFDNNIWKTCPKTQNCSKNGIVHKCNESAMAINEKQCMQKYDILQKKLNTIQDKLSEQESINATLQDGLLTQKNSATSILTKSQGLESDIGHYKILNTNLTEQLADDKKQIISLTNKKDVLDTQIQNLNKEVNDLKMSLKNTKQINCVTDCKIRLANNNKLGITILDQIIKNDSKIILNIQDDAWTFTQQGYIVLNKNPSYGLAILNQNLKEGVQVILHQNKNRWLVDRYGYIRLHRDPDFLLTIGEHYNGNTPIIISEIKGVPWTIKR